MARPRVSSANDSEIVDLVDFPMYEWAGGNLYFDQWNYDFQWQVLPPPED